MREQPLVVLANRLPIDETISGAGTREWRRSPGGLVSAPPPVGVLPAGQPPVRRGGGAGRAARRAGLGSGLPPAARPRVAARAAPGRTHRVLPAHPVSAAGAVQAATAPAE